MNQATIRSMASPALQPSEVSNVYLSRERWVELCLVIFVVVVPLILSSLSGFLFGLKETTAEMGNLRLVISMAGELGGLALVWYVLRKSNRTLRDLGLSWSIGQFGMGFQVAFLFMLVTGVARAVHGSAYQFWMGEAYHGVDVTGYLFSGKPALMFVFLMIVPFFEEIIVRGYVMTELGQLSGSVTLATVASVVLQTSYHLYQGWVSAGVLLLGFSVPAIYYAKTKKLLPVIVCHGLVDMFAFAVVMSKR